MHTALFMVLDSGSLVFTTKQYLIHSKKNKTNLCYKNNKIKWNFYKYFKTGYTALPAGKFADKWTSVSVLPPSISALLETTNSTKNKALMLSVHKSWNKIIP
jgi:glutathione peroxidase-family protein